MRVTSDSPNGAKMWRPALATGAMFAATIFASAAAGASSLGPANVQRRALASVEGRHLMRLLVLPSASKRLAAWSSLMGTTLRHPMARPDDPDQVDLSRYYLVPGGNRALTWIERHAPRGGIKSGSGTGNDPQTYELTYRYPGTSILPHPELEYSMRVTPNGRLGLRVDALVPWSPRKSRFSIVPAGAQTVVVTFDRGPNASKNRFATVTVVRRSTVEAFLVWVNQLPVAPPGVRTCPLDLGASMTLSFLRGTADHPYAIVKADPGGCGQVTVSEFDQSGGRLGAGIDDGGHALTRSVAATLSIRDWQGAIIGT